MAIPVFFCFFWLFSLTHGAAFAPTRDDPASTKPSISVTITVDWIFPPTSVDFSAPGTTDPPTTSTSATESELTVTICSSSWESSDGLGYSSPPGYASSDWPISASRTSSSCGCSTRHLTSSSAPYGESYTPAPTTTSTGIFSVEPGYSLPETTDSCSRSHTWRG